MRLKGPLESKITSHVVFISEITARAYLIADSNKRRTLSRSDIAKALAKSDQFDFLIDIVPREDAREDGGSRRMRVPTVTSTMDSKPEEPTAESDTVEEVCMCALQIIFDDMFSSIIFYQPTLYRHRTRLCDDSLYVSLFEHIFILHLYTDSYPSLENQREGDRQV